MLVFACIFVGVETAAQESDILASMSVDVDDAQLRASIPSTMEVGESYPVRFRIKNNGTIPGEFTAVLYCETSAVHPRIANMQFVLLPGQTARVNFTLVGVRPTEEKTMVRTMVMATPSRMITPLMLWSEDMVVQRIYPSEPALRILTLSVILVLTGVFTYILRRRRGRVA